MLLMNGNLNQFSIRIKILKCILQKNLYLKTKNKPNQKIQLILCYILELGQL